MTLKLNEKEGDVVSMKRSSLISISILVFLFMCTTVSAWDIGNGVVWEWNIEGVRPYGIETLSEGSVWFASDGDPSVFILDQESGLPVVYSASFAGDFATMDHAADDTLWITDEDDRIVHFIPYHPTGDYFNDYPIPRLMFTPDATPYGIAVAPDGMVWFTRWPDPSLGRFNPVTEDWDRYILPEIDFDGDGDGDYPGTPALITFDDDGDVWFTINNLFTAEDSGGEFSTGYAGFGHFDPGTETFTIYNDPSLFTATLRAPWDIEFISYDPDIFWFTDKTTNYFIRVDLSVAPPDIEEYVTPYIPEPEIVDTHYFSIDPDGIFWLAPFFTSNIGTFNPITHDFDSRSLELYGSPINIVVSPLGEVWWAIPGTALGEQRAVGRFIPFTDTDGDGISDEIDPAPLTQSAAFSDGATSGTLDEAGDQVLIITDATDPFGIRMIAACEGGEDPASISICPPLIRGITLNACNDVLVTCGGSTIQVIVGPVEVELENGVVLTALSTTTFTITDMGGTTYRIENTGHPGSGSVTVGILTVEPGEFVIITPPVADANGPYEALLRETITLDGSGSTDSDGFITAYHWAFGDGNEGTGESTDHAYPAAGLYTATLTVTDDDGLSGSDTAVITVLTPSEGIDALKDEIRAMGLRPSVQRGFFSKLDKAQQLIDAGRNASAIKILNNFITLVDGQRGLSVTNAQADAIIEFTRRIIASLR